jgi:CheY-like chemotaxis protein
MKNIEPVNILMADDDPDDRMLMKEALDANKVANRIDFVEDGEELLNYLNKKGRFLTAATFVPGLILLDLNMPKIDGREALRLIKADVKLRRIPVIVLTTSKSERDISQTYDLGVNSFICKPMQFDQLIEVTRSIVTYWFGTVALPKRAF